ncbi:MAG TPA: FAD-dependent oxidoreductase, partial [Acidimicrobiales bacterium]|nr:FAD-dependent oxidoreductase [Acidimicrobiales bacterium]
MDRDRPPGPRSPHPQIVAVVGGGITGLAAAWELVQGDNPVQVIVLEGSGCLGGKIQAANVGGITVDTGPDAFLARRPEAVTLCGEIGIADELVAPGSRRAYVWSRGRLRALPDGLALGIPTRLGPVIRSGILSPAGLARAAVDLLGVTWPR